MKGNFSLPTRVAGLTLAVGGFLPRVRLPSLAGPLLTPADLVDENALAVCIYNPSEVNPFPLPPRGVDLARRFAMLKERGVTLFVISGLGLPRLASWLEQVGLDLYALSDAGREFTNRAGIPIKQVEGHHFRTHVAFVLQEERILSILLETDPVHDFERLLMALDVAEGRDPGSYVLSDRPWYAERRVEDVAVEAEEPEVEPVVEFTSVVEPEPAFELEEDEG